MALIQEFRTQGDFLFKYRGTLPLLILIPALIVYTVHELNAGGFDRPYEEMIRWFGVAVGLLGLAIRIHAVGHAAPRTSGRNTGEGQVADNLNTTGMYSTVRHPLYLGNLLMWAGPAIWTMDLWFILFFIAAFWLYYERIMYAEEAFLIDTYGDRYKDWASSRPAFIPKMGMYKKAEFPMNWKKILRQEKNGLVALFLVFWLFDIFPDVIQQKWEAITFNIWAQLALASLIIYLILKFLKKSAVLKDKSDN